MKYLAYIPCYLLLLLGNLSLFVSNLPYIGTPFFGIYQYLMSESIKINDKYKLGVWYDL